jgi:hypothetical protein
MVFDESDYSVLSESYDDIHSHLNHEYDTCLDDISQTTIALVLATMATMNLRNLTMYVLMLACFDVHTLGAH